MNRRMDMHETSLALAARSADLAVTLAGTQPTSKSATTWRFRARGSLSVTIAGKDRGLWYDHEAGTGGDALDLVCHLRGCDRKSARVWALAWLDRAPDRMPPTASPKPAPRDRTDIELAVARRIWGEALSPHGTPLERYLQVARGLALPPVSPLRFHPACPRGRDKLPAMVALMTDPITGDPCGIHRTYLQPNGDGKAKVNPSKMMLGNAGVVRLVPDEDVTLGLGIAEGIAYPSAC